MTCELTNFTVWGKQWFEDGWEGLERFCDRHALVGVELLASGADLASAPPTHRIEGVHLSSLGSWLPLVGIEAEDYCTGTGPVARADSYEDLVRLRADELRAVAEFAPRYAVWHAAYTPTDSHRPVTTGEFLQHLSTLVRDVTSEFRPPFQICFENAYGVSWQPDEPAPLLAFLEALSDLPAGVCLDIGHHLNRHRELTTPEAAVGELYRLANGLRQAGVCTTVLHLHWTPPELVPAMLPGAEQDPGDFFARSDQHHPLCATALPEAVAQLAPEVVVHEMGAMSLEVHENWLAIQTSALRGATHGH